jgi:SpoIID/LytB domain protein
MQGVRRLAIAVLAINVVTCSCARHPDQPVQAKESRQAPTGPTEAEVDAALLRSATATLGDREGCILIMDPGNGRIRAVVNPRLAYEQAFPPGSTIKAFTSLAAMRSGLIDSHSAIRCAGQYATKEFQVVCSHPKSDAPFDLPQALAYSCNYYFARTAERLSKGVLQSTLAGFGFGARTGVAGSESPGRIPGPDWNIKTALGEGDQLLVTPVQLLRGYVALVCGGHLFRPREGDAQGFKPDEIGSQSISGLERAALVRGMRGAVSFGTAAESGLKSLPLYVYGKTGTSTSSSGFRTQGWFVGFGSRSEADNQALIAVVGFLKHSHGSECAAMTSPIFAEYGHLVSGTLEGRSIDSDSPGGAAPAYIKPDASVAAPTNPAQASGAGAESAGYVPYPSAARVVRDGERTTRMIKVHLVRENITKIVPLEEYVLGVLRAEASFEDRIEALKCLAIVSRTYALRNAGRHHGLGYDFCNLTHCERYTETPMKGDRDVLARRAVGETEGQVLWDERGALVDPYFHASCGGMTADIGTLWGVPAPGYLRGVRDDYCRSMPNNAWVQRIPVERLARALQSDSKTNIGSRLTGIQIVKRDHTGRAELVQLDGTRRAVVRGWDFKMILGRSLGWNMIKSSRFEVSRDGADFVFRGSGFGHGLGLCQEGAHEMARLGFSYSQIISHYFPGTSLAVSPATPRGQIPGPAGFEKALVRRGDGRIDAIQPVSVRYGFAAAGGLHPALLSRDGGPSGLSDIMVSSFNRVVDLGRGGETLSSEHFILHCGSPASAKDVEAVLASCESARLDLLRRLDRASLSLAGDAKVQLIFHGTTQEFMATTGQPWWSAAATRGASIELQPLAVLKKRGILFTTIRHEYAHYVIDRLSSGKTPRWLAEGLAAYFAGEAAMLAGYKNPKALSADEIERRFDHASTPQEMRSLYAVCLAAVENLIETGGEPAIWRRVALGPGT